MALQWFQTTEGHMEVPQELVLDEEKCREAGILHMSRSSDWGALSKTSGSGSGTYVHV